MGNKEIVRAWKDAESRQHQSAEEQALLPGRPTGALDLTDVAPGRNAPDTDLYTNVTCGSSCTFDYICLPPDTGRRLAE